MIFTSFYVLSVIALGFQITVYTKRRIDVSTIGADYGARVVGRILGMANVQCLHVSGGVSDVDRVGRKQAGFHYLPDGSNDLLNCIGTSDLAIQ